MASESALDLVINLRDNASKSLNAVAKSGGFLKDALSFAAGGILQKGIEGVSSAVTGFFQDAIGESQGWNKAFAQTEAVIKSTGGAAGLSAQQMGDLAASLSGANGVSMASDDAILAGENLLATFTNIGEKTFPKATAIMVDMAQAMGTDVKGGAIQLGKALNDPIAGIGALSRVGVTFSDEQKELIKNMMAVGDTAGAQNVIINELTKEFGGSAAAAAKADGGMFQLSEQMANVKQTIGDALLPILHELVGFIASPAVMGTIQGLADLVAKGLTGAFDGLKTVLSIIGPPLQFLGGQIGGLIKVAWDMITTGESVGEEWQTFSPLFMGIAGTIADVITTAQQFATVIGQAFGGEMKLDTLQALPGWLQPVATLFGTIAENVGEFVRAIQGGTDPLTAIGDLIQNNLVDLLGLLGIKGADAVGFVEGFKSVLGTIAAFIQDPVLPALGAFAGWLGEQIPKVMQLAGDAWTNVLAPALSAIWAFIQDPLLPILGQVAGWLGEQIPKVLQFAADAWTNVLVPALSAVWAFIQEHVLPVLGDVFTWLGENLPKAIQTAADFWNNTLYPAIVQAAVWQEQHVMPILRTVAGWLAENIPAALKTAADFWNNTLLPAITAAWNFFNNNILPILKTVASTLGTVLDVAVKTTVDVWNNNLKPALQAVYDFSNTTLKPFFEAFAGFFGAVFDLAITASAGIWQKVLQPALEGVWNFISSSLQPVFESLGGPGGPIDQTGGVLQGLADLWNTTLQPAMKVMADFVGGALAGAFGSLQTAISKVTGFLSGLTDQLKNIQLPDWMTPGSPTPWEIGLRGVAEALGQLTGGGGIAQLGTQLQALAGGGTAGPLTPLVTAFQGLPGLITGLTPQLATAGQGLLDGLLGPLVGGGNHLPLVGAGGPGLPHGGLGGGGGGLPKDGLFGSLGALFKPDGGTGKGGAKAAAGGLSAITDSITTTLTDTATQVQWQATLSNEGSIAYWWAGAKGLLPLMERKVDQGSDSLKAYMGPAWKGVFDYIGAEWDLQIPALEHAWQAFLHDLEVAAQQTASNIAKIMGGIPTTPGGGAGGGGGGPNVPPSAPGGPAKLPDGGVGSGYPSYGGGGGGNGSINANFVPGAPGSAGGFLGGKGLTIWVLVPGLPPMAGQATTSASEALRWQQDLGRL